MLLFTREQFLSVFIHCNLAVWLFTFGVLLLAGWPLQPGMLVIPLIGSDIGGGAALMPGIAQDWLLPVGSVFVLSALAPARRQVPQS